MLRVEIHRSAIADLKNRVQQLRAELDLRIDDVLDRFATGATEGMRESHEANAHEVGRYINRTEDLSQSIGYSLEPPASYADIVKHQVRLFAATVYAYDVEHGVPGRSKAYPYFWPEIHSEERRAMGEADLTHEINEAVAAVGEGG